MEKTIKKFFEVYKTFPESYNGQRYLTVSNGKKIFFNLFIKKYGLKGDVTKYSNQDILRRIRMVEFFDWITKNFNIRKIEKNKYIIETIFFRMVIVETKKKKLELLSFYNYK